MYPLRHRARLRSPPFPAKEEEGYRFNISSFVPILRTSILRVPMRYAVTYLLLTLSACCAMPVHALGAKPNIVVIVADDLGYADVRFNPLHGKEIATPHLDALASQRVNCRQGNVSGHVCSPT